MKISALTNVYKSCSPVAKVLLFVTVLLILVVFFKALRNTSNNTDKGKEGYQQNDKYLFKEGNDVYDEFYATIYDYLVFNNIKNEYEVLEIINKTRPTSSSGILDVGSGTGHHVAEIANQGFNVVGIDISPSMVKEAKIKFPNCKYKIGDALNTSEFRNNSFTHILCMYFTIYYFKDKRQFFNNCMEWLMPGGYLMLHVVNRQKFDPILPPGNPLYVVSPQKYAKERITHTKVTFNEFVYNSDFKLDEDKNRAVFEEKFTFNDGKVRKQEQVLYMEPSQQILNMATEAGFIVESRIDLVHCAYEYQYVYVLQKP